MHDYPKSNYHAHTVRCKHAKDEERAYIENAIDMGLEVFGFSDHVPIPFRNGFVSGIRMDMEQAEEYIGTIRRLAEEYKDQIRVLVGFEAEYLPEFYEDQISELHKLHYDYMIMGQHFLESEQYGPYMGTPTGDEERLRGYVDMVIEGMKTGSYKYLAHPDLFHFTGMDSVYDWEMTRLCKEMKRLGIPLEMNILGMGERRHYPSERFWKIAGEIGNDTIFGMDAHMASQVLDGRAYDKCAALAQKCGLKVIDFLDI